MYKFKYDEVEAVLVTADTLPGLKDKFPEVAEKCDFGDVIVFNGDEHIVVVTGAMFEKLFEELPVPTYDFTEICSQDNIEEMEIARKGWNGTFIEWNGFAWVKVDGNKKTIYTPTPEDLSVDDWVIVS